MRTATSRPPGRLARVGPAEVRPPAEAATAIDPPPDTTLADYEAWAARLRRHRDDGIERRHRLSAEFPTASVLEEREAISRELDLIKAVLEHANVHTAPKLRIKELQRELAHVETTALPAAIDDRLAGFEAWALARAAWEIALARLEHGRGDENERDVAFNAFSQAQTSARASEDRHMQLVDRARTIRRELSQAEAPQARPVPAVLSDIALRMLLAEAGVYRIGAVPATTTIAIRVWGGTRFCAVGDGAALAQLIGFAEASPANGSRFAEALQEQSLAQFEPVGTSHRIRNAALTS